jgi:DNA-binding CsgD family transcriptional regulator
VDLLFDRLNFGLVGLDDEARVLTANAAARRVFEARDAIDLMHGALRALRVRDQLRLQALLDAARGRGAALPITEATMTLDRATGKPPYLLHALSAAPATAPLTTSTPGSSAARAAVTPVAGPTLWLLLCDPQCAARPTSATLMQAFAMTVAEAELVLALVGGDTVAEHAHRRGISVGTVRRHLERALRKARVGRQAELVRLALALTLPLDR